MLAGLRRLRALGATTAVASTPASNEPALRLYHAVGFAVEQHQDDYQWHG